MASDQNNSKTDASVIYRRYEEDQDQAQLLSLIRELQGHECSLYDRMKPAESIGLEYIEELKKSCEEHKGEILVAVSTGNKGDLDSSSAEKEANTNGLVGYVVVLTKVASDRDEEINYEYGDITDLAVTEKFRKCGIGSKLLQICEEKVRAQGVRYLRTEVLASNKAAVGAYHKFGFNDHLVSLEKRLD